MINFFIATIKFPADQIAFDGNLLYGVIVSIFFIYDQKANQTFTLSDVLKTNIQQAILTTGIVTFTFALKFGKAAPV